MPLLAAAICLLALGGGTGTGMTAQEKRLAGTLESVAGAGQVRVTLYYEESGGAFGSGKALRGALVVASGAGDMAVRLRLTEAVETLLNLPGGSVMVLKMEEMR